MPTPLQTVLIGDEDLAKQYVAEANRLYEMRISGQQFDSGVRISIVDGPSPVAYIEADYNPQTQVRALRGSAYGEYYIEHYGYNHRKDAMLPRGTFSVTNSFDNIGLGHPICAEVKYISDGVTMTFVVHDDYADHSMRDTVYLVIDTVLNSLTEDFHSDMTDYGTVAGFTTFSMALPTSCGWLYLYDRFYSAHGYGVLRTGSSPRYSGIMGFVYDGGGSLVNQTYGTSGDKTATWKVVSPSIFIPWNSKTGGSDYAFINLPADIVIYNNPGHMTTTYYPLVFPLGNHDAMVLHRKRNANSSYIYGGTFELVATRVSGSTPSTSAASVVGVTSGYFQETAWHWDLTSTNGTVLSSMDDVRSWIMMDFSAGSNCMVPLATGETLWMVYRWGIGAHFGMAPDRAYNAQWVCISVTPGGFAQKGVVQSYWDDYAGSAMSNPNFSDTTSPRFIIYSVGVVALDTANVRFYATRMRAEGGSNQFNFDGFLVYSSGDGGATWSEPQPVVVNGRSTGEPDVFNGKKASPPKLIANNAGDYVIAMSLTYLNTVGGVTDQMSATLITSKDGVTFETEPIGTVDISVSGAYNFAFHNPDTLFEVMDYGNHDEGFSPSPYKHLPTYYGTASKASRDNAADPNL